MPWFKVDDGFDDHPKVLEAGNAAVGLWLRCATWSARQLTDGHIPAAVAHGYGSRREIDRLVSSTLWLPNMTGDGFVMPDYLEYNPSADEVKQRRADEKAAKRRGGLSRARNASRDEYGHFR